MQHCRYPYVSTSTGLQQANMQDQQPLKSADHVSAQQGAAAQQEVHHTSVQPQESIWQQHLPLGHATSQQAAAAQRGLSHGMYRAEARVGCGDAMQQTTIQQAAGLQSHRTAPTGTAMMYVKPPWAVDDSYQVCNKALIQSCMPLVLKICMHDYMSLKQAV